MGVSIVKNAHIKEPVLLQYRCEFFNAFNHPVFNGRERWQAPGDFEPRNT